jgi:hypothetical protein
MKTAILSLLLFLYSSYASSQTSVPPKNFLDVSISFNIPYLIAHTSPGEIQHFSLEYGAGINLKGGFEVFTPGAFFSLEAGFRITNQGNLITFGSLGMTFHLPLHKKILLAEISFLASLGGLFGKVSGMPFPHLIYGGGLTFKPIIKLSDWFSLILGIETRVIFPIVLSLEFSVGTLFTF